MAPAPAPPTHFLTDKPRSKTFDLAWPVEVGGVDYRQITMRRLTTGEIGAFVDKVRSASTNTDVRFPLFYDANGALIADDVWNALDPDDSDALVEAGNAFLPARFRTATTAPVASIPSDAGTTDSSSAASPASA